MDLCTVTRRDGRRALHFGATLLVALLLGARTWAVGFVLSDDGEFAFGSPESWLVQVQEAPGSFVFGPALVATGGNPGVHNVFDVATSPGESAGIGWVHLSSEVDPATDGGIASVSLSIDVRASPGPSAPTSPSAAVVFAAIQEDPQLPGSFESHVTQSTIVDVGDWRTVSASDLGASDFSLTGVTPDFSEDGSPLFFAFFVVSPANFVNGSPVANDLHAGVDNWQLEVEFLPEPQTGLVGGVFALWVLGRLGGERRAALRRSERASVPSE